MDRKSWPWKKKSSDKGVAVSDSGNAPPDSGGSRSSKALQENHTKTKYVQISMDSYSHLTSLEDQVKSYEEQVRSYEVKFKSYEDKFKSYEDQVKSYKDQVKNYEEQVMNLDEEVKELNEQVSASHLEMTNKDNLVKQHAKVAEDAVSGWEKAEAETAALKVHLESVTLLKLTAEDRASHLDGALKECMRQIRNLKEEHEQKLHELSLNKAKQFDRMKNVLEAKIADLDQELLRSGGENSALARTLQERSNMIIKLSEERSQANLEIERMKNNIDECEKEINSLKYEVHVVSKELEIRNEEKNMSVRSAEVANKQHLEGVKKITKLEAECQRLRGLVRKKLPGPAALAQMKLEVESLGKDYGESRLRRSPNKPSSPQNSTFSDYSFDGAHKYQKENELLTERLLVMEEETKMLKEALSKRNSELQASRSLCAKTAGKVQNLEAQLILNGVKSNGPFHYDASNPPSLTSLSEDGNEDDAASSASRSKNIEDLSHRELMDDFLEMEKLANQSNDIKPIHHLTEEPSKVSVSVSDTDLPSLTKIQSTISTMFESLSEETEKLKLLEDVKQILLEMRNNLPCENQAEIVITEKEKEMFDFSEELIKAVSQIHEFVMFLTKEAKSVEGKEMDKLEKFEASYNAVMSNKASLSDFILELSHVFKDASELGYIVLGYKNSEGETCSSDCIDKVALPENKDMQVLPGENYQIGSPNFSDSTSDPDIPREGNLIPPTESSKPTSFEEFEQLKIEKENILLELAKCTENLESTRSQLQETEHLLAEVKSELTNSQKMNSLSDIQLKCMAESYNSLETRAEELQKQINLLQEKTETLENELLDEKRNHEDTLAKCKVIEDQLQSIESGTVAETDARTKQEKELAMAAEKLAECQETIFLLGKQLKTFRPQTEFMVSPLNERVQKSEEPTTSDTSLLDSELAEMVDTASSQRIGLESPMDVNNYPFSPSDYEGNNLLKSPINSKLVNNSGGSSSSTSTPEKHSRGFTRFFSSKGKPGN